MRDPHRRRDHRLPLLVMLALGGGLYGGRAVPVSMPLPTGAMCPRPAVATRGGLAHAAFAVG